MAISRTARGRTKLGEMLKATERARGAPGPGRGKVGSPALPTFSSEPTLSDLGLTKKYFSRRRENLNRMRVSTGGIYLECLPNNSTCDGLQKRASCCRGGNWGCCGH